MHHANEVHLDIAKATPAMNGSLMKHHSNMSRNNIVFKAPFRISISKKSFPPKRIRYASSNYERQKHVICLGQRCLIFSLHKGGRAKNLNASLPGLIKWSPVTSVLFKLRWNLWKLFNFLTSWNPIWTFFHYILGIFMWWDLTWFRLKDYGY